MKYYVVADIHGFYTEFYEALKEKGYFEDKNPHKLVICGDMFDRGNEDLKIQEFVGKLIDKDEVILIRGNHEDLLLCLIEDWEQYGYTFSHHKKNGTVGTVMQLTNSGIILPINQREVKTKLLNTPFIKKILPKMVNYYETNNYIFVHGWIPCDAFGSGKMTRYIYNCNWRMVDEDCWNRARWYNGMEAARQGVVEPNKTIVCGHWHTSYGHSKIEGLGQEFGPLADFSPYVAKGIIALDACTTLTGKVNCYVIED